MVFDYLPAKGEAETEAGGFDVYFLKELEDIVLIIIAETFAVVGVGDTREIYVLVFLLGGLKAILLYDVSLYGYFGRSSFLAELNGVGNKMIEEQLQLSTMTLYRWEGAGIDGYVFKAAVDHGLHSCGGNDLCEVTMVGRCAYGVDTYILLEAANEISHLAAGTVDLLYRHFA